MQDMPGTYALDVIGDGGAGVGTCQANNEGGDGGLVGWGPHLFFNAPHIAVHMVGQDTSAVRFTSRLRPSIRHDVEDSLQLFGAQLS